MKNAFYHSFAPGFNWVYVLAPVAIMAMVAIGYLLGARICKHRFRHKSVDRIAKMVEMTKHVKVVHWGVSVSHIDRSDIAMGDTVKTVTSEVKEVSGKCARGSWRVRYDRAEGQPVITSTQIATVRNEDGTRSAKMVKTSPTIGTFFTIIIGGLISLLFFKECGAGVLQFCCNCLSANDDPFWALIAAGFGMAIAMGLYIVICYFAYMKGREIRQNHNEGICVDAGYYTQPQIADHPALATILKPYCVMAGEACVKATNIAGEVIIVGIASVISLFEAFKHARAGKHSKGGRRLVSRKGKYRNRH